MTKNCPHCHSSRTAPRELGKRTGAAIGSLTGAAYAAITVLRGAALGAMAGASLGPVGIVGGGISGALFAAVLAGSAGGAVGSAVGTIADNNILDNRRCLSCGFIFRDEDPGATEIPMPPHPGMWPGGLSGAAVGSAHHPHND